MQACQNLAERPAHPPDPPEPECGWGLLTLWQWVPLDDSQAKVLLDVVQAHVDFVEKLLPVYPVE